MFGKFSFPSAKEAMESRKGDGDKKRKRLPNTSHVDKVTGVQLTPSASAEPSLTKCSTKKIKASEDEGFINIALPFDASAYSDPSFVPTAAEPLLLLAYNKRLINIGPF